MTTMAAAAVTDTVVEVAIAGGVEVAEDIVEVAASEAEGAEVVVFAATHPPRGRSMSSSCMSAAYPGT